MLLVILLVLLCWKPPSPLVSVGFLGAVFCSSDLGRERENCSPFFLATNFTPLKEVEWKTWGSEAAVACLSPSTRGGVEIHNGTEIFVFFNNFEFFDVLSVGCMFTSFPCMLEYWVYLCVSEFTRYVLEYSDKAFIDFHSLPQVKFILWSFQFCSCSKEYRKA